MTVFEMVIDIYFKCDKGNGKMTSNSSEVTRSNTDTITNLGYTSMADFTARNAQYLKELNISTQGLSEEGILLSHFLNRIYTRGFEYSTPVSYTPKNFEKRARKIIKNINKNLSRKDKGKTQNKYMLKLVYPKNMPKYSLIVVELNAKTPYTKYKNMSKKDLAKHRLEVVRKNLNKFALFYNAENGILKTDTKENKFCNWMLSYLQADSKSGAKEVSWQNTFDTITNNSNIEITEIKFSKTDVNQRDVVILKPTDPKTMPMLIGKLKNNLIMHPDLSYIERIGVRVPNGTTHYIEFVRRNELSIIPKMSDIRPSDVAEANRLKQILGFEDRELLVDVQRDWLPDIFDNVGVKRRINDFELNRFSSYSIVSDLKNKGLIALGEEYNYTCTSDICHRRKFDSYRIMKRCRYCRKEGHLYKFKSTIIIPDYRNIANQIITLLGSQGINAKVVNRAIYSRPYELVLAEYGGDDCLFYSNSKGLSDKMQEDFKLDLHPFIMLDFSGEPKSVLPNYSHISGGAVLRALLEGQSNTLKEKIDETFKNYRKGLRESLEVSVNKLEGIKQRNEDSGLPQAKKGPMFEKLIRPPFNLLFASRSLSSKNKPDGIFFLNDTDYVLWDGKRYDSNNSTLTKYIRKRGREVPKDIAYIRTATGYDKLLKRNLKFYVFITKGITGSDFESARAGLLKYLKKLSLDQVKINCIDIGAMIKLEKGLSEDAIYDTISKDRGRFLTEFELMLKNNAYIEEQDMESLLSKFKTLETSGKMDENTFKSDYSLPLKSSGDKNT